MAAMVIKIMKYLCHIISQVLEGKKTSKTFYYASTRFTLVKRYNYCYMLKIV